MHSETFRVAQLNELIQATLRVTFPDEVWVEGEVASLKRPRGGNVYFQLVDSGEDGRQPTASIDVVLFDRQRREVNELLRQTGAIRMTDGVQLRIRARVDVWPPQGRLRLVMSTVDPEYTLGRLAAQRDRVLRALADAGLLGANAGLPFPAAPRRIGLITANGSAAHADFVHELERSGYRWEVLLVDAPMQGPAAEAGILRALRALSLRGVDVIALVRGGGARTDLAAFDGEDLARAIASLPTPVVTGIGHEIDSSVADAVAARAHKTPTACAAALVEQVGRAEGRAEEAWRAVAIRADQVLAREGVHLAHLAGRSRRAGQVQLVRAERRVGTAGDSLRAAAARALDRADQRLRVADARITAADPDRALARGWSITRTADGRVVRDPADVAAGDTLHTLVAGGSLRSRVVDDPETTP